MTRKAGVIGAGLVLVVLAYAWINGGEQALRPIEQSVTLPENAQ
jgi:hypothetical protein